ncbi:protein FATTY ACID EXPORT 1, chloroplastic [Malania oleifera]|uniref:protein FATTY ACID EXPORT 1, chloroplastic n=1 Tax=Malania oleifera TaxID=397392 RepID=UPI0025AEC300|nr:protein FATTY ACID EXPORT 1, chloroplastic [Malania oleifera]
MSSAISQLSCFSSINRNLHLRRRPLPYPPLRSKLSVIMSLDGRGDELHTSETKNNLSYRADASKLHIEGTMKSHPIIEEPVAGKVEMNEPVQGNGVTKQKKAAKIHDFCFGIPFGALVLSGGLLGFIFSRNFMTLSTNVLFGGALLALSTFSLKIWRQGKSSLPFILGQAVLSAALLWKNLTTYYLLNKLFPAGFYAVVSAAMLCFYLYVVISGGNPPPKKTKLSSTVST